VTVTSNAALGKTHFIVGNDSQMSVPTPVLLHVHKESNMQLDVIPLTCDGRVCMVLFAPDENLYATLAKLIEREEKHIYIASYMVTDRRITQLLKEACERGVTIEVITDLTCLRERANKLGDLYEISIPVYIYMPASKGTGRSSLMHNKFVLFEKNAYGRKIVWTGSANLTRSALHEIHHENVVVLDDASLYDQYEKKFRALKKQCSKYENCTTTNAALHEKIRLGAKDNKNTQSRAKTHAVA
jgi:phosphatidylserine/phosphatidylglycerophosphate/cardiolipin synthase-like enzyme